MNVSFKQAYKVGVAFGLGLATIYAVFAMTFGILISAMG